MSKSTDPFASPPKAFGVAHLEDRACRAALKAAGVPPVRVISNSGIGGTTPKLTFDLLVEYADFPVTPVVTEAPLDDVLTLMTKFESSRLWKAWVAAWDARPDAKTRVLVLHGSVTGFAVAYATTVPPNRPHIAVGHSTGSIIYVESLSAWCRGIEWAASE